MIAQRGITAPAPLLRSRFHCPRGAFPRLSASASWPKLLGPCRAELVTNDVHKRFGLFDRRRRSHGKH